MTHTYCLRCGKKLTNEKSIKLGYGKICYALHQQENRLNTNNEIINTLNFLKCEINMLKNQLKLLKINGISQIESIERIKQIKQINNEFTPNELNYRNNVLNELKEIFVSVSNVQELLIHIEINKEV